MKKAILSSMFTVIAAVTFGQGQIGNSDFEQWESVAGSEEPVNWNSFLSATGGFAWAAANQLEQSSDVPAGSTGTKSARIWSRSTFGIVANGNMTLGQINMGSTTASDPSNYNFSKTSDPNFSEGLTDAPDSLVFWVKFNPVSGGEMARVKATLHDDYDYRDPEDAASADHVVAIAELNYAATGGSWVRKSVPFDYSIGTTTGNTHILITFTTNMTPGGGDGNDEVFIDDVQLIYNPNSVNELQNNVSVALDNINNTLSFDGFEGKAGTYEVYATSGALVQSGDLQKFVAFNEQPGMYVIHTKTGDTYSTHKVIKQ
ncbi:MAG: T9SS type A sorting domain-containing protein [Crocinitomicaceae bacterium]